jgi:tetratricopeptide (TPR) repeat protein
MAMHPRRSFTLAALVLLAIGYAGRLDGEYVWDDVYLVEHNASLREPGGLRRILTMDLWGAAGQPRSELYHPLPMLTLWAEVHAGLDSVVAGRVIDLSLHLAVGALVLSLLLRLRAPPLSALLLALLFVAHPSGTEPVMWLTGRHDLLGALCTLAALCLWPRGEQGRARILASALLCGAAFLCKEPYVVAPLLVIVLAWVERASARRLAAGGLGVLAVAAVFSWRRHLGIQSGSDQLAAGLVAHLRNAASIDAHYAAQLLGLSNGATIERYRALPMAAALAVLAVLVIMTVAAIARARLASGRAAVLGIAIFGLSLAPHVLSLPLIGLWANRYAYFPLVGLLVLAGAACELVAERGVRGSLVAMTTALALGLALFGAVRTRADAAAWHDDLSLYGASVDAHPDDGRAVYHYAHAIQHRQGCAASTRVFAEAARLAPDYARAWRNLAGCFLDLGRPADAIEPAQRAVALEPGEPAHHYNLGAALLGIGRREEGVRELREALRLDPDHARARALLERAQ